MKYLLAVSSILLAFWISSCSKDQEPPKLNHDYFFYFKMYLNNDSFINRSIHNNIPSTWPNLIHTDRNDSNLITITAPANLQNKEEMSISAYFSKTTDSVYGEYKSPTFQRYTIHIFRAGEIYHISSATVTIQPVKENAIHGKYVEGSFVFNCLSDQDSVRGVPARGSFRLKYEKW